MFRRPSWGSKKQTLSKVAGYQMMGDSSKRPDFPQFDPQPIEMTRERAEEAGIEVFEVVGSIKWFDASKGYGFIVPDNGLADILLHVTCLQGRRLSDSLRRSTGPRRGAAPAKGHAGVPHPQHGREHGHPPFAAAAADARHRHAGKRLGAGHGEVVQPGARFRLLDARRGNAGRIRAHGNSAALRFHRIASGSDGHGALGSGSKGCMAAELRRTDNPGCRQRTDKGDGSMRIRSGAAHWAALLFVAVLLFAGSPRRRTPRCASTGCGSCRRAARKCRSTSRWPRTRRRRPRAHVPHRAPGQQGDAVSLR